MYESRPKLEKVRSSADGAVFQQHPASLAFDSFVEVAEGYAKWEPYDGSDDTEDTELGLADMRTLLETDHLGMIWGQERGDLVLVERVRVVIHGGPCGFCY